VAKFPLSPLLSDQRRRRLLGVKLSKMLLEFLELLPHDRCTLRNKVSNSLFHIDYSSQFSEKAEPLIVLVGR
jgi:hypothetical protein